MKSVKTVNLLADIESGAELNWRIEVIFEDNKTLMLNYPDFCLPIQNNVNRLKEYVRVELQRICNEERVKKIKSIIDCDV